jgi:protein-tyrosine-phosphatase
MSNIKKILVVCTGNACRSPMAEGFLKKHFKAEDGFEIVSAGIFATDGLAPTPDAILVMNEQGIDISAYSSTAFSSTLANAADLVLVMAEEHKNFVIKAAPGIDKKVFLYKEFAGADSENKNIIDPIGQSVIVYRSVRNEIRDLTQEIIRRIKSSH